MFTRLLVVIGCILLIGGVFIPFLNPFVSAGLLVLGAVFINHEALWHISKEERIRGVGIFLQLAVIAIFGILIGTQIIHTDWGISVYETYSPMLPFITLLLTLMLAFGNYLAKHNQK